MPINLRGRSLLTLLDYNAEEIRYLLSLAQDLKRKKEAGERGNLLQGKNVVLLFDKPSTRTRSAFEVACHDENGHVTFLSNSHMGHKESVSDTAHVLGRMYDGIEYRGYAQETVQLLAQAARVPVWNGLTDDFHPTQALADALTIMERVAKPLNHVKLVYVGDVCNNVAKSLAIISAKLGLQFVGLGPQSRFLSDAFVSSLQDDLHASGGSITQTDNKIEAMADADVVYTDVWVSMGEEDEMAARIKLLRTYQVDADLLNLSNNPDIIFMHCLPACHDTQTELGKMVYEKFGLSAMEVTDEVFHSRYSVVFDQAENRVHTIKAVMVATIGNV